MAAVTSRKHKGYSHKKALQEVGVLACAEAAQHGPGLLGNLIRHTRVINGQYENLWLGKVRNMLLVRLWGIVHLNDSWALLSPGQRKKNPTKMLLKNLGCQANSDPES